MKLSLLGKEWFGSWKDLSARLKRLDDLNDGGGGRRTQEV